MIDLKGRQAENRLKVPTAHAWTWRRIQNRPGHPWPFTYSSGDVPLYGSPLLSSFVHCLDREGDQHDEEVSNTGHRVWPRRRYDGNRYSGAECRMTHRTSPSAPQRWRRSYTCSDGTNPAGTYPNLACPGGAAIETILTVRTQASFSPPIHLPGVPSTLTLHGQVVQKVMQ